MSNKRRMIKNNKLGCPHCRSKAYVQTSFFPVMFKCTKCSHIWTDELDNRYENALIARQSK